jgi:hypothetical protein
MKTSTNNIDNHFMIALLTTIFINTLIVSLLVFIDYLQNKKTEEKVLNKHKTTLTNTTINVINDLKSEYKCSNGFVFDTTSNMCVKNFKTDIKEEKIDTEKETLILQDTNSFTENNLQNHMLKTILELTDSFILKLIAMSFMALGLYNYLQTYETTFLIQSTLSSTAILFLPKMIEMLISFN